MKPTYRITRENFFSILPIIKRTIHTALNNGPVILVFQRETRTIKQNRLLWALLSDISTQIEWWGQKLCQEDWKHIFTASLDGSRMTRGLNGEIVILGKSTSKMPKDEFSDLIELIYSFGAEREVKWSETVLEEWERYDN